MHGGRPPRDPPRKNGRPQRHTSFEELDRGKLAEHAIVAGRVPENLLLMRPSGHDHAAADPRRRGALPVPIGLVEVGPKLAPPPLEKHGSAIDSVHADTVEIGGHSFGRRYLRHGPVI